MSKKKKQKVVPSANEVKITSTTEGPKTVVEIVITNPNTPTVVTVENGDSDSSSDSDSSYTSSSSNSNDYCEDSSDCSGCTDSDCEEDDYSDDYSNDEDYENEEYDREPQKMYGGNESVISNPPAREMGVGQREIVLRNSNEISGEAVIELLKLAFNKTHEEAMYVAHLCSQQGEAVVKYINADEEQAAREAIQAAKDEIVLNYGEQREMNTIANLELEFRDRTTQETPPAPAPNEHDRVDVETEETEGDSDVGHEDDGDDFIDNGFSDDGFGEDDDGGDSDLGPTS